MSIYDFKERYLLFHEVVPILLYGFRSVCNIAHLIILRNFDFANILFYFMMNKIVILRNDQLTSKNFDYYV